MSEQSISQSRLSPPSLSRGLSVSSPTVKQDPSAQRSQAIGKALSQMSNKFAGAFGTKFRHDQEQELEERKRQIEEKKRLDDLYKIEGYAFAERVGKDNVLHALKTVKMHPEAVKNAKLRMHELNIEGHNTRISNNATKVIENEYLKWQEYRKVPENPKISFEEFASFRIKQERIGITNQIPPEFNEIFKNNKLNFKPYQTAIAKKVAEIDEKNLQNELVIQIDKSLETTPFTSKIYGYATRRKSILEPNGQMSIYTKDDYDNAFMDIVDARSKQLDITSEDPVWDSLDFIDQALEGQPRITDTNPRWKTLREELKRRQASLIEKEDKEEQAEKDRKIEEENKIAISTFTDIRRDIIKARAEENAEELHIVALEIQSDDFIKKFGSRENAELLAKLQDEYIEAKDQIDTSPIELTKQQQEEQHEALGEGYELIEKLEMGPGMAQTQSQVDEGLAQLKEIKLKIHDHKERAKVHTAFRTKVKEPFEAREKIRVENEEKKRKEQKEQRYSYAVNELDKSIIKVETIKDPEQRLKFAETLQEDLLSGDIATAIQHSITNLSPRDRARRSNQYLLKQLGKDAKTVRGRVSKLVSDTYKEIKEKRELTKQENFKKANAEIEGKLLENESFATDDLKTLDSNEENLERILKDEEGELARLEPNDKIRALGKIRSKLKKIASFKKVKTDDKKEKKSLESYDGHLGTLDKHKEKVDKLENLITAINEDSTLTQKQKTNLKKQVRLQRDAQAKINLSKEHDKNNLDITKDWSEAKLKDFKYLDSFRKKLSGKKLSPQQMSRWLLKVGEEETKLSEKRLQEAQKKIDEAKDENEKAKLTQEKEDLEKEQDYYFELREQVTDNFNKDGQLQLLHKVITKIPSDQLDYRFKERLLTQVETFQKALKESKDLEDATTREDTFIDEKVDLIDIMGIAELEQVKKQLENKIKTYKTLPVDAPGKSKNRNSLLNMANRFLTATNTLLTKGVDEDLHEQAIKRVKESTVSRAKRAMQIFTDVVDGLNTPDAEGNYDYQSLREALKEEGPMEYMKGDDSDVITERILKESTFQKLVSKIDAVEKQRTKDNSKAKTDPETYMKLSKTIDSYNPTTPQIKLDELETNINKAWTDNKLTESSWRILTRRKREVSKPLFKVPEGDDPITIGRNAIDDFFGKEVINSRIGAGLSAQRPVAYVAVVQEFEDWLFNIQINPKEEENIGFMTNPSIRKKEVDEKVSYLLSEENTNQQMKIYWELYKKSISLPAEIYKNTQNSGEKQQSDTQEEKSSSNEENNSEVTDDDLQKYSEAYPE